MLISYKITRFIFFSAHCAFGEVLVGVSSTCVHQNKTMPTDILLFFLVMALLTATSANDLTTRSRGCHTQTGQPCQFPYFHNGLLYDGK